MQPFIKHLALTLLLVMSSIISIHAAPPGRQVSTIGWAQGGSDAAFTWRVPAASSYKVRVKIPPDATATNALYRVYPQGNPLGGTVCSPTDTPAPCFEIAVNQAANQAQWVQLTLDNDRNTVWEFTQNGFVAANADNVNTGEQLSIAAVSFEDTGLKIGKQYGGGWIFYLDETGQHGLIAALTDQSTGIQWHNGSNIKTDAKATAVGTGKANTQKIVLRQGVGSYAAQLCDDWVIGRHKDWFLPSKDELDLMYKNIGPGAAAPLTNIGGFTTTKYWSSSERNHNVARLQSFHSGYQSFNNKAKQVHVRAVRAF